MGRQRNNNRNYAYNTYDAPPEDIVSLIPAATGEYVHSEDFTDRKSVV